MWTLIANMCFLLYFVDDDIRMLECYGLLSLKFQHRLASQKGYRDCPCLLLQADPLYLCGSRVDIDYSRAQKEQWRDRHHESRDWVCFKVLRLCTICMFKFYVFVFHAV